MKTLIKILSIFLLFLLVGVSGCATINIDGRPVPEHAYTQTNPKTGIKVDFLFIRYIEKSEGKEKFLWPDYLELDDDLVLPRNTKTLCITVQIVNVHETPYKLEKVYTVWSGGIYPYAVTQTVSESSYTNRIHNIDLPLITGAKIVFNLRLLDEDGGLIMNIGPARYYMGGSN